jgi:hypothetical protein
MSKKSPFDFVKGINNKTGYDTEPRGYNPYLTNQCFSMHMDTIMLAEEMNQAHWMAPWLQYTFYYYAVRKGKRFGFPKKNEVSDDLQLVMDTYKYSQQKAEEVLGLLTPEQLTEIRKKQDKGGRV